MPVNEPLSDEQLGDLSDDDLRDRVDEWADEWASSGDIGYALTGRDLIYEVAKRWRAEVERLRAALAARPQLMQVGWYSPGMVDGPNVGSLLDGKFDDDDEPVYRAVAGSATPTGDDDE